MRLDRLEAVKVALYVNIGADLTEYDVDVAALLTRDARCRPAGTA